MAFLRPPASMCLGLQTLFLGIFLNNTRIEKVSVYLGTNSFRSEAATQRFSLKKLFLKNLQNSQENNCVRVSFLVKLQVPPTFLVQVFSFKLCEIFTEHLRWLFLSGQLLSIFLFILTYLSHWLFLYPVKISENLRFSDVFMKYRKRPVA